AGFMDQFDSPGGGSLAVGRIDDLAPPDVEAMLACDFPDFRLGADEQWTDDSGCRAVDRAAQRSFVAGMHDDGRHHRYGFGSRNQSVILARGFARTCWHDLHDLAPNAGWRRDGLIGSEAPSATNR